MAEVNVARNISKLSIDCRELTSILPTILKIILVHQTAMVRLIDGLGAWTVVKIKSTLCRWQRLFDIHGPDTGLLRECHD
jgi:hypothetical protein